jgi:hypothetical protein
MMWVFPGDDLRIRRRDLPDADERGENLSDRHQGWCGFTFWTILLKSQVHTIRQNVPVEKHARRSAS